MVDLLLWVGRIALLTGLLIFVWRAAAQVYVGVDRATEAGKTYEGRLRLLLDNSGEGVYSEAGERMAIDGSIAVGAEVLLGRDEENQVVVRDRFTSGRHARVFRDRDGYWLEDLGSRNGTLLNGHRVTRRQRLVPGDQITIGSCSFKFTG